ncbi:MAG: WxL domain-containing protein [Cumulibacter sp.]
MHTLVRAPRWRSRITAVAASTAVAGAMMVAVGATTASAQDYEFNDSAGNALTYSVPDEWVEGETLEISGTNWKTQNGSAGSVVAVKLDEGGVSRQNTDVHANVTIWALVQADADGDWTAEIEYPTAQNSNATWSVGSTHTLRLLTGSMVAGDVIRTTATDPITIVQAGEPTDPVDPTDPEEPVDPVSSSDVRVTVGIPEQNGGLTMSLDGSSVNLGEAKLRSSSDALMAEGLLPLVTVTDTRQSNAGWNINGQSSAFNGPGGTQISGAALGWQPELVGSGDGQQVKVGPKVQAGVGFTSGSTLASAGAGEGRGTAQVGAKLIFAAPTNTVPGQYASTITLTLS